MKEEWLFLGAMVPVDMETTAALVAEIKRLIGVVGGMALAQPEQKPMHPELRKMWEDHFDKCFAESAPQRPWQGLTYEEVTKILEMGLGARDSIETALDKLKEQNG